MYNSIELNYSFDETSSFLNEKTMDIHFNILYKGYLNRLNKALLENNYDFEYSLEELVNHIDEFPLKSRDDILFNLGGVINHERYFLSLTPNQKKLSGKLLDKINETYGTFDNFKKIFIEKALTLVGSGYTNLVLDKNNNLNIINTSNQELPDFYGFRVLISLDLWEHAYYLTYYQDKTEYINRFFNFLDYDRINRLYEKETQI